MNVGGQGLGFRERPGLGSDDAGGSQKKSGSSAASAYGSLTVNPALPSVSCYSKLSSLHLFHLLH